MRISAPMTKPMAPIVVPRTASFLLLAFVPIAARKAASQSIQNPTYDVPAMNQLLPTLVISSSPEVISRAPSAMPPGFVTMAASPTPMAMMTINGPMAPITSTILPRPKTTVPTERTIIRMAPSTGEIW